MNDFLHNLEPKGVWHHFREILAIPRPSKKEEKITWRHLAKSIN